MAAFNCAGCGKELDVEEVWCGKPCRDPDLVGTTMGIGEAVKSMWNGKKVVRQGWNGKGMWIALRTPNPDDVYVPRSAIPHVMTLPYVYMKTADGHFVPWLCSQTDLLATDWEVVE